MIDLYSTYRQDIFRLSDEKTDRKFFNSNSEHAAIVHQAIARGAEQYIYIYCNRFDSEVSNNVEYCEYIEKFLKDSPSHRLHILFSGFSPAFYSHPLYAVLRRYAGQVEMKSFDGQMTFEGRPVHFTVSDDRAFRLETDIEKRMAYGNFNDPGFALRLRSVFDKVFSSSLTKSLLPAVR